LTDSSFFNDVYEVVILIPEGKVTSYGAIAHYLGTASSARMVGWAMNQANGKNVPAHRVLNRIGMLTGKHHFGSTDVMQKLLEAEGIGVENDVVNKFDELFWDPVLELSM